MLARWRSFECRPIERQLNCFVGSVCVIWLVVLKTRKEEKKMKFSEPALFGLLGFDFDLDFKTMIISN